MCRWCVYVGKSAQLEPNPDTNQTFMIPKSMVEDSDGQFMSIIDRDAFEYVYSEVRNLIPAPIAPLKTTGDGNCLLHAVSRSIWGIENYHEMLRKKMQEELSENIEWYKKSSPDIVEEDWNKAIQMASKAGQHLEFIHFFALCHVIKRPIILYASDDDMRDYGQGELGVCATFVPVRISVDEIKAPPVYLTWSSKFKAHFIPLVGYEGEPFPHLPLLQIAFAKNFGTQEQLMKYVKQDAPVVLPPSVAQMNAAATEKEQPSMLESLMLALQNYQKKSEMSAFARMMEKTREKKAKKAGELSLVTLPNGQQVLLNRQPGQRFVWDAENEKLITIEADEDLIEKAEKARQQILLDRAQKTEFEGKYYDYVFDITFAPDQPPKKLPYNRGDNPSLSAFEFLTRNGITPNTRNVDKIATHITRAIQSKKKPVSSPWAVLDSKPPPTNYKHLPHHPKRSSANFPRYVLFPTGNKRMVAKLQELSEKLPDTHTNLALSPADVLVLERTMSLLQSAEDPTTLDQNSLHDEIFPLMDRLLKWPPQSLFPAIDFCRLLILHPKAASHYTRSPEILKQLIAASKSNDEIIRMLSLRFVANMFARDSTTRLLLDNRKPVLSLISESTQSPKAQLRSTVVGVLVNFATHSPSLDADARLELSMLALQLLKGSTTAPAEDESVYSTVLALGTLMYYDDTVLAAVFSDNSWVASLDQHRKSPVASARVKDVCEEFVEVLRQRGLGI